MSNTDKISWEVKDNIGFVTLTDEPENSMDTQFFHEMYELTANVIPAAEIKAVIVSGKGRHFSSGADLDDLSKTIRNESGNNLFLMSNYRSFSFFDQMTVPVIMAIKGVCLGAGLEFALHGHFRLCAEGALLGLPEVTFNLIPAAGGVEKMVELVGKAKAMEIILSGKSFSAAEALEMGVVDAVVPKKILMWKAVELAEAAAENYRKYNKREYLEKIT